MNKKIFIDGRPIRKPYSGVAQYSGRIFANLPRDNFEINLITPNLIETRNFFNELGMDQLPGIKNSIFPRKSWTLALRYMPLGGRLLPEVKSANLIHLTHFDLFPRELRKSVKKVLTIHDMIFIEHPEWFTPRNLHASRISCRQLLNGNIDLVLTPSLYTKNQVIEFGFKGPVIVTPLASTLSALHKREGKPQDTSILDEKPYVLFLGNLEPRKGIQDLIEAWRLSKAKNISRLLLLGKSAYLSDKIDSSIKFAQMQGIDIIQLGFVTENFKAEAIRKARLMIYPSLAEGFGIPVLDAMSAGLPLLTTKAGSIPEVTGNAAATFEAGNVENLRAEIDRLIEDESLLKKYSQLGLERSKLFNWKSTALTTELAYQTLLSENL
jgi:glycosyltransferase involved in cell wall biosynthesis